MSKLKPGTRYSAFTVETNRPPRELITPVKIRIPLVYTDKTHEWRETKALWDTGATNSVVQYKVAEELGLIPITKATTCGIHGRKEVDVFLLDILLMDSVLYEGHRVSSGETGPNLPEIEDPGIIIGMDIIGTGDATLMHGVGNFFFSFIIPSILEPYNFQELLRSYNIDRQFKEANKKARSDYNARRKRL